MNVSVPAGYACHISHAVFFLLPRKLEVVSHPLIVCNNGNGLFFKTPRFLVMQCTGTYSTWTAFQSDVQRTFIWGCQSENRRKLLILPHLCLQSILSPCCHLLSHSEQHAISHGCQLHLVCKDRLRDLHPRQVRTRPFLHVCCRAAFLHNPGIIQLDWSKTNDTTLSCSQLEGNCASQ